MRSVLVLGLGNRLMMDDGVGVAAVEALARQQPPCEGLRFEVGETDFEYCLALAEGADDLILVDAAVTGSSPGSVTLMPLHEAAARRPGISQHHLHFLDLLLQRDPAKRPTLIGIEPHQITYGLGLSAVLGSQFEIIVERVRALVHTRC